MIGSWAGAMGQPQFMPSNFLELAVDFDGDGRKDIWASVPDVLASIANYLQALGLEDGRALGPRGHCAAGFDYRAQPRDLCRNGRRSASGARTASRCRQAATRSCSFRAARRGRRFWSAKISR